MKELEEMERKGNELKAQGLCRVSEDGKTLTIKTKKNTLINCLMRLQCYKADELYITAEDLKGCIIFEELEAKVNICYTLKKFYE